MPLDLRIMRGAAMVLVGTAFIVAPNYGTRIVTAALLVFLVWNPNWYSRK